MKKIYILTQYYPPETGAPQNRLHSFAQYLVGSGYEVNVFTAFPNYPQNRIFDGYRSKWKYEEVINGVTVLRSWIFVGKSRSILSRLLNYFSFVVSSFFRLVVKGKPDYIFCESPPLFLGITAVFISWIKDSKLIFNVSDLWPESAEKLDVIRNRILLKLSYKLEAWIYKNAFVISGQTQGIVTNIKQRFPDKPVIWFPNGVDVDFFAQADLTENWRARWAINQEDMVVLYGGVIGHAQGLGLVLDVAESLVEHAIQFVLVGDGPEKESLSKEIARRQLANIKLEPAMAKSRIPSMISACDIYWVPLRKLDLFRGAIPSKLFEPLAMGKPILLGVEGEAYALFIQQGRAGRAYEPENALDMKDQLLWMLTHPVEVSAMGKSGRTYVHENFDRKRIHERFLEELETVVKASGK